MKCLSFSGKDKSVTKKLYRCLQENHNRHLKMKVRIKRWHGVAVWKWEIDEEVRYLYVFLIL